VQRIKTRAQYEAAMAGGITSRSAHFVLHRAALESTARDPDGGHALFAVSDTWIGAVVPKRWAKRSVTRNGIKRQIYNVSASFEDRLPAAAHVVRLRVGFPEFRSAWSDGLKKVVRDELHLLFERARA
jgi:ribonuclease P protein component